MAVTTHRPVPLPHTQQPAGGVPTRPGSAGGFRLQKWYIDKDGRRRRTSFEVPVDAENELTEHKRYQCPHESVVNGGGKERCAEADWMLPGQRKFCPHHGKMLEAPKEASGERLSAFVSDVFRMHGRSAAPWAIPVLGAAAEVGMTLGQVTAAQAMIAVPALAGPGYLAAKWWLTQQAIKKNRIEKGQKKGRRVRAIERGARKISAYGAELGVWAALLAGTDWSSLAGRVVAAAATVRWAIGSKPWWDAAEGRRTRGGAPPDVPPVVPAPVQVQVPTEPESPPPDPVQVRAVTTWAMLIGSADGPLAGTELVEFERLPACPVGAESRTQLPNWKAKVVAKVAGKVNMRENRPNLLGRIAAAYQCTYADVSFYADEDDLSVGWLRVQPDNPLAEVRLWTGIGATDWARGRSIIGRYDDGEPIFYQWWDDGGAAHDLIGGSSGSGKSEAVAQLILIGLHSQGLVLDWVGDPQGGQSYGALKDHVDWFARDRAEIILMLLAALKEMLRRNDILSQRNIKTWRATKDMPLLVITLDEVQSYIDDPVIGELLFKLSGQARKCGIKVRLITQIIAAYNLGGNTYIKDQVKTGQTLTFRSETDQAGRSAVEGDSLIDPTALPKRWGKNTCAAGGRTAGLMFVQGINGRDVYGRADYTGDTLDRWLVDSDGNLTITPGVFGPEAQQESGILWGDRRERAQRLIAAGRSDEDLLTGGKAVELIEAATAAAATGTVFRAAPPPEKPKDQRAKDIVLVAAQEAADRTGVVVRDAIVKATQGMPDGTRNKALTDLVADGKLGRIKNGVYMVVTADRSDQDAMASQ